MTCHIDNIFAIMNARVTFSMILSLLILLPSSSVCQSDGIVSQNQHGNQNSRIAQSGMQNPSFAQNGYYPPPPTYGAPPVINLKDQNQPSGYGVINLKDQSAPSDQNNIYSVAQEAPQSGSFYSTTSRTYVINTNGNIPSNSRGCLLPEQSEGGHYELNGCIAPCSKHPNDLVPEISVLAYTCKENYILNGNNISVCINQKWTTLPSCLKICPPLRSTSVDISCNYQGEIVSCTKNVLPGTRAMLACKASYKLSSTNDPVYREITCLHNGLWNNLVFRCLPECGTSVAHGNPLVINGFESKVGIFPWHVGIYEKQQSDKYKHICGGSLISNNLVISAAHCFYDQAVHKVNNVSNYAVGAGKHYRDWDAKEDFAQKSSIESIQIGKRYLGHTSNYVDDIALLKLESPFQLTTLVRPVCMDWSNQYEREQLQEGQSGKVVGWGQNIDGEYPNELQEINMPYISYRQCLSQVPIVFKGFLTSDKFCAGHLNGSSVCEGDSGGGLCFEKNGIWFLRGIVSVSPVKKDTCDYNTYVAFTSISNSLEWIRQNYTNE